MPARNQGASRITEIRPRGLLHRCGWPRGTSGGHRHDGTVARRVAPGRQRAGSPGCERTRPGSRRRSDADNLERRRHPRDYRGAQRALPLDRDPQRHLLRDNEPPGRRQGARTGGGTGAGHRCAEQLQLQPPPRGGRAGRCPILSRGRRLDDRPCMAGRGREGRYHLRRIHPGVSR